MLIQNYFNLPANKKKQNKNPKKTPRWGVRGGRESNCWYLFPSYTWMQWEHANCTEKLSIPSRNQMGSSLAKMCENKITRNVTKLWRTAWKRKALQERGAADFSWHSGRKFLHQIIQDLDLIFWPIPPVAQTNKTSKWLVVIGTDQSTQLFTEIYSSGNIQVFKGWNNSAMATKTILLPTVVKYSHNIPNFVECTQL